MYIKKRHDYIVLFFFRAYFRPSFVGFFLHAAKIFKVIYLCEYLELRGLPHHSFDVFLHEDSILKSFRTVCELLGLIWIA